MFDEDEGRTGAVIKVGASPQPLAQFGFTIMQSQSSR